MKGTVIKIVGFGAAAVAVVVLAYASMGKQDQPAAPTAKKAATCPFLEGKMKDGGMAGMGHAADAHPAMDKTGSGQPGAMMPGMAHDAMGRMDAGTNDPAKPQALSGDSAAAMKTQMGSCPYLAQKKASAATNDGAAADGEHKCDPANCPHHADGHQCGGPGSEGCMQNGDSAGQGKSAAPGNP